MATDGRSEARATKARVSPVRNIIGGVLLIVFAGSAIFELMAYQGYKAAVSKMEPLIPRDSTDPNAKKAPPPRSSDVIGKSPSAPLRDAGGGEKEATYVWRGLRRHALKAYYEPEKPENLIRYETE